MKLIIKFTFLIILVLTFNTFNKTLALNISKSNVEIINAEFIGTWKMLTIVTGSNCPYVLTGSTTESTLKVKPLNQNNTFKVFWSGGNWKNTISTLKFLNENEVITERFTEMKTNDNNIWKAALVDHIYFDENQTLRSESIVTQYKNGNPVGEYKTISILTKLE